MTPKQSDKIAVHIERLSRRFDPRSGGDPVVAVDGVSFDVYRGEIFGLLGHNGAGKTTTVRLLNGVLAPSGGRLRVLGHDPVTEGAALRRHTGVLTETPSLDEKLTAQENLTFYGRLYGVPEPTLQERVPELLDAFELADRAQDMVGGYSRGMKQRLALARALFHRPELLFLDEPTAGLDPVATRGVHQLITRLSQAGGQTVILCTHNLVEAQRLCHRVAVMEQGQLVAVGTPTDLAEALWRGTRLEVELDRWDPSALPLPSAALDVTWDAAQHVLRLSIPHRDAVPELVAALVSNGLRVYRVEPREPTLEDVYFALHEEGVEEETA